MNTALSCEEFIPWACFSTRSDVVFPPFGLFKYMIDLALVFNGTMTPLGFLARPWDAYPSAKRYNLYQRFVYSLLPAVIPEIFSLEDLFNNRGIVHSVVNVKKIYAIFWKVTLLLAPHIKQLQEDKGKHTLALLVLKFVGEKICLSNSYDVELLYDATLAAVLNDTPEVIELITRISPQLVCARDNYGYSLVEHSVKYRCENAYNILMHKVSPDKYFHIAFSDHNGNNLLHLAGKSAPMRCHKMVTGATLQMQRDLQWFQEVSNFVRSDERTVKNIKQETPFVLFLKEHMDLRQEGEKWVKKTARSYTITAEFIFAIVLAAALIAPGGNNGDVGKTVNDTRLSFIMFAVSDVMSLITSATSLLLFRSFDTEQYAVEDFLYNLPKKLIVGLVMLFISVATMLIAFSATLYIMFVLESSWILILIAAMTCLPIALFVTSQLALLVELISSTYGGGFFGKQRVLTSDDNNIRRLLSVTSNE